MNTKACIQVQKLSVKRGKSLVLQDIDCELAPGRIIGLLGQGTSGTVTVLGLPAGHKSLRHRVGYMTQAASVYDDLTIQQNVAYFAKILGLPEAEATRVIEATDLQEQAKRLVLDLSGGQRNRVSLAIALLGSPDIVILDEPTVGLDPVLRAELWALFADLAASGICMVVSSHVMDEAMRCDEMLLLRNGQLLAQISPGELLRRTGASDPEDAFLRLIASGGLDSAPTSGPSAARHRARVEGKPS